MKIVIDTNIIASSIYFGGKPRVLVDLLTLENVLDVQIVTVAEFFEQNPDLFEK